MIGFAAGCKVPEGRGSTDAELRTSLRRPLLFQLREEDPVSSKAQRVLNCGGLLQFCTCSCCRALRGLFPLPREEEFAIQKGLMTAVCHACKATDDPQFSLFNRSSSVFETVVVSFGPAMRSSSIGFS